MEGVQFEEERFLAENGAPGTFISNESKMVNFVIKSGLAKNKKQADVVLLVFIIICIIASIILFKKGIVGTPEIIRYEDLTPEQKQEIPLEERMRIEALQSNTLQ